MTKKAAEITDSDIEAAKLAIENITPAYATRTNTLVIDLGMHLVHNEIDVTLGMYLIESPEKYQSNLIPNDRISTSYKNQIDYLISQGMIIKKRENNRYPNDYINHKILELGRYLIESRVNEDLGFEILADQNLEKEISERGIDETGNELYQQIEALIEKEEIHQQKGKDKEVFLKSMNDIDKNRDRAEMIEAFIMHKWGLDRRTYDVPEIVEYAVERLQDFSIEKCYRFIDSMIKHPSFDFEESINYNLALLAD